MVIIFIPYRHMVYEQVYKLPAEIFIFNITILKLVKPKDNLFLI